MTKEIKRYEFKVEYDQFMTPFVWKYEAEIGRYCMTYHIEELQDEILRLRTKHNDWEGIE